jgi:ribosomal protein S18 acetylase RimI-like enzyme
MSGDRDGEISVRITATIRRCREEDLAALEWMGLFGAHAGVIEEAFAAQQTGDALLLLADCNGFPIAQVFIDFARKGNEDTAALWAVRTFPPLQGAGIGGRMLEAAEAAIGRRGFSNAELGVERENGDALRFYERHGWRRVGPFTETIEYEDGAGARWSEVLDQWLMRKAL